VAFADDTAAPCPASQGHDDPMGPHGLVLSALEGMNLRDDQRAAIEQLKVDTRVRSAPALAAHDRVMEAVATSVEAGAFDHGTIDPLVTAMRTAGEANRPAFEDAANRLHAILTRDQREELISRIKDKLHAGHGFARSHMGHDHLAQIGAELGLTDEQNATIHAKFEALEDSERASQPDGEGFRAHFAHMKAMADAFVSDSFDAHALGVDAHLLPQALGGKILSRIEAALPVLTPAQRTHLAEMIRSKRLETALHG
jgi:Spy/CpxP family protein refolding chaperone